MADPRFHERAKSLTLGELAAIGGATLAGQDNPDLVLKDVAPLDKADPNELSFLDNPRYKNQFMKTRAGACFILPEMQELAPSGTALLLTPQPYKSYALAAQAFYPERKPPPAQMEGAHIAESARIGEGCTVEYGAVIKDGAEIGKNCWIEANTVIGENVVIGDDCRIGSNVTISHSLIGHHVRVYPGCRIGQDGFGFAIDPAGHVKVPQLGRVIINDSVEIGANTAIDRGSGPDTEIGQGTWIDNLVQIGHNVKIGKGCVIVAQVGISGSTTIEDYAVLAGQAGVAGHLTIGKGARIAAQSGVMRDVPAGQKIMGAPGMPAKQFMRQVALLNRLIKKKDH